MVFHEALKACLSGFTPSLLIFVAKAQDNWEEFRMLQLALTILIYLIIVIPVGRYLYHIAA